MSQTDYALTAISFTIIVIVFVLDLMTPLGMAIWALYILPLGLTRWAVWEPLTFVVAGVCTVLVILGYFFSPIGPSSEIAIVNRGLGLLMVWIAAFFLKVGKM
jgi:hypothetical protein